MQPVLLQHLQAGLEAHRSGNLPVAEQNYRTVLAQAPETLDAINLLGRLLVQTGRPAEAVVQLRHAIETAPIQGPLWLTYAEALIASGDLPAAIQATETACSLLPQEPDALFLHAEALRLEGLWDRAAQAYRQVLALRPGHAAAVLHLATCLKSCGDLPGALVAARQAVALAPQAPECHNNLGNILSAAGQFDAAIASLDHALQLRPNYAAALVNKGATLREMGRTEEALPVLEQALQLGPGNADLYAALALTRHNLGQIEAALPVYSQALALRPDDPEIQWNHGLASLAAGDFTSGWPACRSRWQKAEPPLPRRNWPWPLWNGSENPAGKRLLLWGEQGLGDRLLFLQYLPALVTAGAHVTLETDPRLFPLLRRSIPGIEFAAEARDAAVELMTAQFDAHLPLGDLPAGPPPGIPWLKADTSRAEALRKTYLGGSEDRLVGLSWRSANPSLGGGKSVAPADLAPLADMAGCRFVCLQYGTTDAELSDLRSIFGERLIADPAIDPGNDLDGLAAQIAGLDLTLTVSNVTAHIAGSLGRPVWVLAPSGKSLFFYLMTQGERTAWYPSMRVFRPLSGARPATLISSAAEELERLVKSGRR